MSIITHPATFQVYEALNLIQGLRGRLRLIEDYVNNFLFLTNKKRRTKVPMRSINTHKK